VGPVEGAIRDRIGQGRELRTPARKAPFVVDRIDQRGVVLLLGKGAWHTRLSWECLEGIVTFLSGRGWIIIGGRFETAGEPGTLDEYLKRFSKRSTAPWVAAMLAEARVVEVSAESPVRLRLIPTLQRSARH